MALIRVDGVGKTYHTRRGGRVLIGRGGLGELFRRDGKGHVTALEGITFHVDPGECLGIIGANGSGKSTLLKIIAGVTAPTSGSVEVHGRVASLLELGAGFHPMLTGRENVYLNAHLLGMRTRDVDNQLDEIVAFSGIAEFIDYPVDTYSSGMYVRIAFAVAAYTNPDIFLIDEVLSVGDEEFQRKCRRRIGELREQGKTIVFVSHDLGIVNSLCNRVVLLSQGKMIQRESAKAAIDFYLSQIGTERGLHTFGAGDLEGVFSNGRFTLFHKQQALTASAGVQVRFRQLGQWHQSQDADWEVVERRDDGCRVRGRLSRLPVTIEWDFALHADQGMTWRLAVDCERDVTLENFEANLFFPTSYQRWRYDDDTGPFPEIVPEDLTDTLVLAPEVLCAEAGVYGEDDNVSPPINLQFEAHRPHLRGGWANSDYMTGCRIFHVSGLIGESGNTLVAGKHDVLTVRAHMGAAGAVREAGQGRRRTVTSGPLTARFDRGTFRLEYNGVTITKTLHLYASLLIGNLWNDSFNLRWDRFESDADILRVGGASRRFPFRLWWELQPAGDGAIDVNVTLEALEPLAVQEHHTTVMLLGEYHEWQTERELGRFPRFDDSQSDWRHLNDDYAPGPYLEATGPNLPRVRMELDTEKLPLRPTPITTGVQQSSRVLQALRTPDAGGMLRFESGMHPYFAGRIVISGT